MKIVFQLRGNIIDPDRFDAFGPQAEHLRGMRRDLEAKLAGLVDPATGKPPELFISGETFTDLTIRSSGAPALVAEVKRRLGV